MSTSIEIIKASQEIANKRKNSLLLLDLEEIDPSVMLIVQNIINGKKFKTLDVILQTPGGDIGASFQLTKLLRNKADNINIIVPLFAKSAGTLICLGADKILMTDLSELGPLDSQIEESSEDGRHRASALNRFKALEQIQKHTMSTLDVAAKLIISRSGMKISEAIHLASEFTGHTSGTLYSQLNPKKIGESARALEIGERYGITVLTRYMGWSKDNAKSLVNKLVKKYPSHDYVIDLEELIELNLPAEELKGEVAQIACELRLNLLSTTKSTIKLVEPEPKTKSKGGKNDKVGRLPKEKTKKQD